MKKFKWPDFLPLKRKIPGPLAEAVREGRSDFNSKIEALAKPKEPKTYGKKIDRESLLGLFEPDDGTINLYYGRIGNGKTYAATADILEALERGDVVYANWHVQVPENDQRNSFFLLITGLFGLKRRYFRFPAENFHYFSPDDVDVEMLSGLTDCRVFIDEGQWIFDSYEGTRFSKAKRRLILHTRHCNRELNIITQRPTAIQVSARGNVNIFYKCEKRFELFGFKFFCRTEFQDMTGETVDETQPISRQWYFGSKRVYNAYNSKYLRGGIPKSQEVYFEAWYLSLVDKFHFLSEAFKRLGKKKKPLGVKVPGAAIKNVGQGAPGQPHVGVKYLDTSELPF